MSKYLLKITGSNDIINVVEWNETGSLEAPEGYVFEPFVTGSTDFINYITDTTQSNLPYFYGEMDGYFTGELTGSIKYNGKTLEEFINETEYGNISIISGSDINILNRLGHVSLISENNVILPVSFADSGSSYNRTLSRITDQNISNYLLKFKLDKNTELQYLVNQTELISSGGFDYYNLDAILQNTSSLNGNTFQEYFNIANTHGSPWYVDFDLGDKSQTGNFYGNFFGNVDITSASMDSLTVTGSIDVSGSLVVNGELTLSSKIKVEIFNNSTTYTIPSWAKKITAYVVGAGGGGGGGASGYMHEYANLNELYPIQFDSNACGHEIVMGGGGGASGAVKVVDYIANKHFIPGSDMEIMVGAGGKGGSGGSPLYDLNGLYTGDGSGDVGIYTTAPDGAVSSIYGSNRFGFKYYLSVFETDSFVDETWNAVGKTPMHNTNVDEILIRGVGAFDPGNVLNYSLLYDWTELEQVRILIGRRNLGWYDKIQELFESGTTALQIRIFYTVFRNLNRWAPLGSNVYNLSKNNIVNNLYKKTSNSSYYFNKNYFPLIKSNIAFSETLSIGGIVGPGYYYPHNGESGGTSYIKTLYNGAVNKVVATGGIGGTGGLSIGTNYPLVLRIEHVKDIDYSMGDYSVPGGGHDGDDTSQYGTTGDNINVFSSSPGGHGVSMVTDVTTPSGYNLLFPNYMNTELSNESGFKYKNTAPNLPIEYNNELPDFLERWPYFGTSTKLVTSGVLLYTDTSDKHKYNNVKYMIPNLPLPTGGGGGTGKNGFALDTREISSQTFSEKKSITNRFKSDTNPSGVIPTTFIRDMAEQIVSKTMLGYGGKCFKLNETTNLKEEFTELEYNRYGYELPVDYTQVPRTLFIGKGGNGGHININDYDTGIYGLENYDIVDPIPTSLPENGGDFGGGGGGGAGTYNPSKLRIEQIPGFELVKGQNGADGGNGVVVLIIYN
jgi:hypothetical protein